MKLQSIPIKISKGFSIVEVAVAMGVVTLMLTTFLGIFGPAQRNVQRALSSKDASAMKDALSTELSVLRSTETAEYANSFEKAVSYITGSHDASSAVLIYRYKAVPVESGGVGILPPYDVNNDGIPGRDYTVQTAVRRLDSALIDSELPSVDGPVLVARMTQLVRNASGNLDLSEQTGSLIDSETGNPVNPDEYSDAVISFRAEFFKLPVNQLGFIRNGSWDFDNIGSSVTEVNMAVRR